MVQNRQLAAIMFTDIVGYTALMGNDEQKAFDLLKKNREIHKPVIDQYNGLLIKEIGDGVMASFNTVSDAVNAALKIQQDCNAANDFQLRIGIHQGEVVFEENDIFGDAVNIASRIQTYAKPGSIYISDSVHHNVTNKINIQTKFVKEELLKNVKEPVRIYEIVMINDSYVPSQNNIKTASENSIAVLPFANMSSDPEQEFFSDGISEEIINMLAQVSGLKVAGRTSAFSFKGKNQDLRLIGEQLSVNYILEGSVRKSANKLRITAQLIKVSDGYHLWSEKYDRELDDIFNIQDEISLAILNAIKIKLFVAEKEAILKKYTDNTEAYQLYLQGRFYYNLWAGADNFNKAIEYYKAAIKIEPDYALAYSGMATSYFYLWFLNFMPPEKCLPQMKEATQHSLQLDNEIAESHLALGYLKMYYEWDYTAASDEFKKAIELNPNIPEAHEQYAMCMAFLDNYTLAREHASIAINLDPFSLFINFQVPVVYWMEGDYEKVLECGRRLVELEPNFYGGHLLIGAGLLGLKRYTEAVPEMEKAVYQNYSCITLNRLGLVYGLLGEIAKAREVLEKMKNLVSTQWVSNGDIGIVYMALGESDNAFRYFDKAIETREGLMLFFKYTVRFFPELEQDPRTKPFFSKNGLPYT